ncbi:MAG: NADH-quinone oxidoreductase subunit C [Candidatus Methanomethylicota archaeon]|nr:NADH-quinone oxidoreductase subunit C [Candidatus Culexmicrobium cathedralense]RLE48435.1 MAG: NADH-quinone oxidoreductase subunit C [Candidatus Verstraetearchaeota archaeon]
MLTSRESMIIDELKRHLGDKITKVEVVRARRVNVEVPAGAHRDVIKFLRDNFDVKHIVTITGVDLGEDIELIYHLSPDNRSWLLNVRTRVPKDNPVIESIVDLIPGATLYEREVFDLLGVKFEGHPNLERLLLPDDWPEGEYPLRKDWKVKEV